MGLIEQLGGYEKAKQKAENALANQVTRISYKTKICINGEGTKVVTGAYVRDIKKALLEYRRQHNIFEEGDWVIIPSRGNGIFQVSRLLCRSDIQEMIHATDAEIKAKRRLP